jgi:hypothetical protein
VSDKRYKIEFELTDGTKKPVQFTAPAGDPGVGISTITKTSTQGLIDTYTITLTNGTKAYFTVTNGKNGTTPTIEIKEGYWYINGIKSIKAQGADGENGISITKAEINANGELVITYSNGNSTNLGKVVGSNGKDGTTPTITISSDGYWVINGTKTSNKAVGAAGDPGKDGKDYVLTDADKKDIAGLVDEISTIPDYWQNELETKADAIQVAIEKAGRNKSAFLWYTDAHWVNGNSKVSPKLLNYLYRNTPMNKVNFGGDIIGDTLLDTRDKMKYLYEWRKATRGLPNHHSVLGNHDTGTGGVCGKKRGCRRCG